MTFKQVYEEWHRYKSRLVKESTMAAYTQQATRHILPAIGGCEITAIRKRDLQQFVDGKLDSGLGVKTVQDIMIVVKMVMRYAAEELDLPTLTTWKLYWPTSNMDASPRLERYSPDEVKRIVRAAIEKPSPQKTGVLISITTGLRIGEVCALRMGDIDLSARTLTVERTVERIYDFQTGKTKLLVSTPKTASSRRIVPLMSEVATLLKGYAKVSTPDYYVCTLSERMIEPRTFRNFYRKFILEEVGIKECIKFHGLRHTFATTLIEKGADVKTVASILGHSDVSTTLNTYVHPSEEAKRQAIRHSLEGVFAGQGGKR